MANEVRTVAGWVPEHEAEAALDRARGLLSPDVYASIVQCCEPEIQLSQDGSCRLWRDEPHSVHLEHGAFEAVARLARLTGLRPEQYLEQLSKRHVRSLAPAPEAQAEPVHATRAWVMNRTVFAELDSGRVVGVPARQIATIADFTDDELARVTVRSHPRGDVLQWRWDEARVTSISVWDLVEGVPRAVRAWIEGRTVMFEIADGRIFGFPATVSERLAAASDADLAAVQVRAEGYALRWEALDEDISVPGTVSRRLERAR